MWLIYMLHVTSSAREAVPPLVILRNFGRNKQLHQCTRMLVHKSSLSSTLCHCATNNRSQEKKRESKKPTTPPLLQVEFASFTLLITAILLSRAAKSHIDPIAIEAQGIHKRADQKSPRQAAFPWPDWVEKRRQAAEIADDLRRDGSPSCLMHQCAAPMQDSVKGRASPGFGLPLSKRRLALHRVVS